MRSIGLVPGAILVWLTMEKQSKEELKLLIERGLLVRAEELARNLSLEEEALHLRRKAIWQMAAANRNMPGTKKLAEEYGFSKSELKGIFQEFMDSIQGKEEQRNLEPCYDQYSGEYLSFEQWMNQLFKRWEKIGNS